MVSDKIEDHIISINVKDEAKVCWDDSRDMRDTDPKELLVGDD